MTRALARFFSVPRRERSLVMEALLFLLAVRIGFGLLPFPLALRIFRISQGEGNPNPATVADIEAIALAIERVARYAPFRAVCLQQAFAALLMMRRRGLAGTVHLGLSHKTGPAAALEAHAWSLCGEMPVTGVEAAAGFVAVAAFTA